MDHVLLQDNVYVMLVTLVDTVSFGNALAEIITIHKYAQAADLVLLQINARVTFLVTTETLVKRIIAMESCTYHQTHAPVTLHVLHQIIAPV
jgi:hypothetical protein